MEKEMQSNIWKYALILITNKRIFIAILGVYYFTVPGITAWWIGVLLLIGSMAGVLLELPSGYISDKIGHKQALVISRLSMMASTLFFLFATNIWFLAFGSIFLSAAWAFQSGAGSAFMHETLKALKREDEYANILGKVSSIGFAVPVVLTMLVPFLVSISFKGPFLVALFLDVLGLISALLLIRPPVTPEHIEEVGLKNFRQVIQEGSKLHFFRYAFFSGIMGGILVGASVFRAPYQELLGLPVIWFGVLFGAGRLGASLMLAYSGQLKKWTKNIVNFYAMKLFIFTLLFLSLGLFPVGWFVALIFIIINAITWGVSQVGSSYHLEIIRESKFKATLLSTVTLIESIFAGIVGFVIGAVIDKISYEVAYIFLGILMFIFLFPLYLSLLKTRKKDETIPQSV